MAARVAINRCRDLTRAAHQKDTELDENLPAPDAFEDGSVLDAVRALPGKLPQCHLSALLRGIHGGGNRPDDGRTVQHGAELARRARAQLHTMLKEEIEDEVV